MKSGLADDIIKRQEALRTDRSEWEAAWQAVADVCLPVSISFSSYGAAASTNNHNSPKSLSKPASCGGLNANYF